MGPGAGDELLPGLLGLDRVIDVADRLRVAARRGGAEPGDLVEGELRAGGDHQVVVGDAVAVVQLDPVLGRMHPLGADRDELDALALERRARGRSRCPTASASSRRPTDCSGRSGIAGCWRPRSPCPRGGRARASRRPSACRPGRLRGRQCVPWRLFLAPACGACWTRGEVRPAAAPAACRERPLIGRVSEAAPSIATGSYGRLLPLGDFNPPPSGLSSSNRPE